MAELFSLHDLHRAIAGQRIDDLLADYRLRGVIGAEIVRQLKNIRRDVRAA